MNKCIRMGINAFKFAIWGGKSAFLGRKFRSTAPMKISDRKTADVPPQMTNLNAVIP